MIWTWNTETSFLCTVYFLRFWIHVVCWMLPLIVSAPSCINYGVFRLNWMYMRVNRGMSDTYDSGQELVSTQLKLICQLLWNCHTFWCCMLFCEQDTHLFTSLWMCKSVHVVIFTKGFSPSFMTILSLMDFLSCCLFFSGGTLLLLFAQLCGDGAEERASRWPIGPVSALKSHQWWWTVGYAG